MVVQNCGPAVDKLYCGKGEIANIIIYKKLQEVYSKPAQPEIYSCWLQLCTYTF